MDVRQIGNSKIQVSAIGFGAMPLSLAQRPPEADAVRVLHAAFDAGITLVDTADVYCIDHQDIGHNERLVARALREWPRQAEIVVATKGGLERPRGAWTSCARPAHLAAACEASLKALGVETIALYQLHAPDDAVPFADSIGALARLREAGKIQHVGLSNVSVEEIDEARAIVPIASVQNRAGVLDRSVFEDGVLTHCERQGMALLAYSPVGGGYNKTRVGDNPVLRSIAEAHGATPYEVALAWLLQRSPAFIPIPGASRVENARSSARAALIKLSDDEIVLIDAIRTRA